MVANTQDRRSERSVRNRLLLSMNGLATLTSFVTAIAVPGANSDLPLGLDKFKNLLIPGFEKFFPNMNEVQRQNIISMVMRPLEEIPFGSDITRVVYFPKKSIKGVLLNRENGKNTELRISAISISDACAEAAIIRKEEIPLHNFVFESSRLLAIFLVQKHLAHLNIIYETERVSLLHQIKY
jgi:hypothetical protein